MHAISFYASYSSLKNRWRAQETGRHARA